MLMFFMGFALEWAIKLPFPRLTLLLKCQKQERDREEPAPFHLWLLP